MASSSVDYGRPLVNGIDIKFRHNGEYARREVFRSSHLWKVLAELDINPHDQIYQRSFKRIADQWEFHRASVNAGPMIGEDEFVDCGKCGVNFLLSVNGKHHVIAPPDGTAWIYHCEKCDKPRADEARLNSENFWYKHAHRLLLSTHGNLGPILLRYLRDKAAKQTETIIPAVLRNSTPYQSVAVISDSLNPRPTRKEANNLCTAYRPSTCNTLEAFVTALSEAPIGLRQTNAFFLCLKNPSAHRPRGPRPASHAPRRSRKRTWFPGYDFPIYFHRRCNRCMAVGPAPAAPELPVRNIVEINQVRKHYNRVRYPVPSIMRRAAAKSKPLATYTVGGAGNCWLQLPFIPGSLGLPMTPWARAQLQIEMAEREVVPLTLDEFRHHLREYLENDPQYDFAVSISFQGDGDLHINWCRLFLGRIDYGEMTLWPLLQFLDDVAFFSNKERCAHTRGDSGIFIAEDIYVGNNTRLDENSAIRDVVAENSALWFLDAAPETFSAIADNYLRHNPPASRPLPTDPSVLLPPLHSPYIPPRIDPGSNLEDMPQVSPDIGVSPIFPEPPDTPDALPIPDPPLLTAIEAWISDLLERASEVFAAFYDQYLSRLTADMQYMLLNFKHCMDWVIASAGHRVEDFLEQAGAFFCAEYSNISEAIASTLSVLWDFTSDAYTTGANALVVLRFLTLCARSYREYHGADHIYRRALVEGRLNFPDKYQYPLPAADSSAYKTTRFATKPPVRYTRMADPNYVVPDGKVFTQVALNVQNAYKKAADNTAQLPRIILPETTPLETLLAFQDCVPEYNVCPGVNPQPHPFAAAARTVFRNRIINELSKLATTTVVVGGSTEECAIYPHVEHNCAPILSGRDYKRHFLKAGGAAKYAQHSIDHKFEDCDHDSAHKQIVALFSAHDIPAEQFIRTMVRKNVNRAFIALNLPFPLLDERVKQYSDDLTGLHYEREGDKLYVFHWGEHSAGYTHSWESVRSWMVNLPVFKGVHSQAEIIGQVGTSVLLQLDVAPGEQEVIPTMWSCMRDRFYILPELLSDDLQKDGTRHFAIPARRFEQLVAYVSTLTGLDRDSLKVAGKVRGLMAEVRVGKHTIDPRWSVTIAQFYSVVNHALICDSIHSHSVAKQTARLAQYYDRVQWRHGTFFQRFIQSYSDLLHFRSNGERDPSQPGWRFKRQPKHTYNPYSLAGEYRLINEQQRLSDNFMPLKLPTSHLKAFRFVPLSPVPARRFGRWLHRPTPLTAKQRIDRRAAVRNNPIPYLTPSERRGAPRDQDLLQEPPVSPRNVPLPSSAASSTDAPPPSSPGLSYVSFEPPTKAPDLPESSPESRPSSVNLAEHERPDTAIAPLLLSREPTPEPAKPDKKGKRRESTHSLFCECEACIAGPPGAVVNASGLRVETVVHKALMDFDEQMERYHPDDDELVDPNDLSAETDDELDVNDPPRRNAERDLLPLDEDEIAVERDSDDDDPGEDNHVSFIEDRIREELILTFDEKDISPHTEYPIKFEGPLVPTDHPLDTVWKELGGPRKWHKDSSRRVAMSGASEMLSIALANSPPRTIPSMSRFVRGKSKTSTARKLRINFASDTGLDADVPINAKLDRFIERLMLDELIEPEVRLVTISGPPMSAKSTLARICVVEHFSRAIVYVPSRDLAKDWMLPRDGIQSLFRSQAAVYTRLSALPRAKNLGDVGIIDEVFNFNELELAMHIKMLTSVGIRKIILIGDPHQSETTGVPADSPFLLPRINMVASLGMPRDAHALFCRINRLGPEYVTTGKYMHSIFFCDARGDPHQRPRHHFQPHRHAGDPEAVATIGSMQGVRAERAYFTLTLPGSKIAWFTSHASRKTVAFTRHTKSLYVQCNSATASLIDPSVQLVRAHAVDGLTDFEHVLALTTEAPSILPLHSSALSLLGPKVAAVTDLPVVAEAVSVERKAVSMILERQAFVRTDDTAPRAAVLARTNFEIPDSYDMPIAADNSGGRFKFQVMPPAVQKTNVRCNFENAHLMAAIHHNSSAADNWKNLVERQIGPSARKSPIITDADILEGERIYQRFVECFYADKAAIYPGASFSAAWLQTREPATLNAIANGDPFLETSRSTVADAEFKTQSKAKAKPGFAAELPYGQSIIANSKVFNAYFADDQPKCYFNMQRLLRPGVILDYGMTDDELSALCLELGVAERLAGPHNIQCDLSRQDSSHTAPMLVAFLMFCRDCGMSEDRARFYAAYCCEYAFRSRGEDHTVASVSFNLGSGDPFTLLRNDLMELCVIACRYVHADRMFIIEKGDDVFGVIDSLEVHPYINLSAVQATTITVDYGEPGYHAGRFHNGHRFLVDPVRAFMKHLTKLQDVNVPDGELWRSYVSRATNYSEAEVEYLYRATAIHYPFFEPDECVAIVDYMLALRKPAVFFASLGAVEALVVDTKSRCLESAVRALRPGKSKNFYRQFRLRSFEDAKRALESNGIPFFVVPDGPVPLSHLPTNVVLLSHKHARAVITSGL